MGRRKGVFVFQPATAVAIQQFVRWQYAPPYDLYNMVVDPTDAAEIAAMVAYFLDPAICCQVITWEAGELVALCTFGEDGQVPGGDYLAGALDIGLGLRPDLTGQGLGRGLVTAVIQFALDTYQPPALRVTIAAFNSRARRVWQQNGFKVVGAFRATVGEKRPFLILHRLVSAEDTH
jgi:[ribosomal protein S18]-alanine N-acetyltransferase